MRRGRRFPSRPPKCAYRQNQFIADALFEDGVEFQKDEKKKHQNPYTKALNSLAKIPFRITDRETAKMVKGIGDKLSDAVVKVIEARKNAGLWEEGGGSDDGDEEEEEEEDDDDDDEVMVAPVVAPPPRRRRGKRRAESSSSSAAAAAAAAGGEGGAPKRKKAKTAPKPYMPKTRSGGYALLVALCRAYHDDPHYKGFMFGDELKAAASPYCDSPFVQQGDKYHTAWSSMTTLKSKGLVNVHKTVPDSHKARFPDRLRQWTYSLHDDGKRLSAKIMMRDGILSADDIRNAPGLGSKVLDEEEGLPNSHAFVAPPAQVAHQAVLEHPVVHGHELLLVIDGREMNDKSMRKHLLGILEREHVPFVKRNLSVGDMMWLLRPVSPNPAPQDERIVDCIVERKTAGDLERSALSGHLSEQRKRLVHSGCRQLICLVEGAIPEEQKDWLEHELVQLEVMYGFQVHRTGGINTTVAFLRSMTKAILGRLQRDGIPQYDPSGGSAEGELNDSFTMRTQKGRQSTMRVHFGKQLRAVPRLSADRAQAIIQHYASLPDLLRAYDECGSEKEEQLLLQDIRYGVSQQRIGPVLSRKIWRLFGQRDLRNTWID